jgi:hypothetical protein
MTTLRPPTQLMTRSRARPYGNSVLMPEIYRAPHPQAAVAVPCPLESLRTSIKKLCLLTLSNHWNSFILHTYHPIIVVLVVEVVVIVVVTVRKYCRFLSYLVAVIIWGYDSCDDLVLSFFLWCVAYYFENHLCVGVTLCFQKHKGACP